MNDFKLNEDNWWVFLPWWYLPIYFLFVGRLALIIGLPAAVIGFFLLLVGGGILIFIARAKNKISLLQGYIYGMAVPGLILVIGFVIFVIIYNIIPIIAIILEIKRQLIG